jgi:DNA-binding GntR family transcriptional regulator
MADQVISKQEATYSILRQRILDGQYGPGHRLVIDALARELHVSPMPVREAIRRLEAEGWVTYQRNQGAQVAPVDSDSWAETMATLAVLEGYATVLARPHLRPKDFKRMETCNRRMREAIRALDLRALSDANLAFHAVIHERCPNAFLQRELAVIQERLNTLRSTIFIYIPSRGLVSVEEHEALLELLDAGGSDQEIERAAREHKMHTVLAYQERMAAERAGSN